MSDGSAPVGTEQPVGPPKVRPRVLVVDDEELVRLVIVKTLQRAGYEVFEARDGLDALTVMREAKPDLVLTDLNMPRCNGERLCADIKREPATASVHVVLMTGGPLDEARMRDIGCAAVVYKPLPDRLADLLSAVLGDATPPSRPGIWAVPGANRRSA